MPLYIKIEVTGSLGSSYTYESFDLIQFFDEKNTLISISNANLVSHNYINRASTTDTAKWFVPSDGNVPYDTPSNKGILIIKMPDTTRFIGKVAAKSYSNTGGASQIEVFHSYDNGINYSSDGVIIFTTISQTKELLVRIGVTNKILLSSGDKYYSTNKQYGETAPFMTSNTTPSGTVTSSDNSATAYLSFDGSHGSASGAGWYKTFTSGDWLCYQYPSPIVIDAYLLAPINYSNLSVQAPKTWKIQGSNNGSTWIDLDVQTNIVYSAVDQGVGKLFDFSNNTPYLYYRILITANNGSTSLSIGELRYYKKYNKLISADSMDESFFISNGIDMLNDFNQNIKSIKEIIHTSLISGSGKIFEHTIDLSKRHTNKITLG
ncbi:hypothetical protein [Paenibacillus sp. FSL H3-0333]|uniref:hypothetical protein n=1 Tax=Paenibacillus sp. FSL H3-0333 TaxID=2921373 RepID=UPI0030F778AF